MSWQHRSAKNSFNIFEFFSHIVSKYFSYFPRVAPAATLPSPAPPMASLQALPITAVSGGGKIYSYPVFKACTLQKQPVSVQEGQGVLLLPALLALLALPLLLPLQPSRILHLSVRLLVGRQKNRNWFVKVEVQVGFADPWQWHRPLPQQRIHLPSATTTVQNFYCVLCSKVVCAETNAGIMRVTYTPAWALDSNVEKSAIMEENGVRRQRGFITTMDSCKFLQTSALSYYWKKFEHLGACWPRPSKLSAMAAGRLTMRKP